MLKTEKKFIDVSLEIKAGSINKDEQFGYFEGYASTFGNIDKTNDIIQKGAFSQSLKDKKPNDIKIFWNHCSDILIGSYLELREDDKGLFVKGRINLMVERGRDAYALLKAGDLNKMSIGIRVQDAERSGVDGEDEIRIIKKVELFEISLVPIPANDMAEVIDVKSLDEIKTIKDVEALLKTKGFSNNGCKKLISIIKNTSSQRDVDNNLQRDVVNKMDKIVINSKLDEILNQIKSKQND